MFCTTIEIDNALLQKLEDGTVKLRAGQWVQLEGTIGKSRWVGLSPAGVVWIQLTRGARRQLSQKVFSDMVAGLRALRGEA